MRSLVTAASLLALTAGPVAGQRAVEWQVHGLGVVTGAEFVGGGMGVAWRTAGRLRLGAALAGGTAEGAAALRGEAALSYHVNPVKRRGVAPYVAGGVAITATDATSLEYVLLVIGLEARPGRGAGWFVEAGAAGGLRVAGGVRLRRRTGR